MSYQVVATVVMTLLGVGLGAGLLAYEMWFKRTEQPYKDNSYNYSYSSSNSESNFRRMDPNPDEECTICCEKLEGRPKLTLKCKHVFHPYCISEWFKTDLTRRCPICRCRNS